MGEYANPFSVGPSLNLRCRIMTSKVDPRSSRLYFKYICHISFLISILKHLVVGNCVICLLCLADVDSHLQVTSLQRVSREQ